MKSIITLTALTLFAGAARAAPQGALDGAKYRVEVTGDKTERDTLIFANGTMRSTGCDAYGFSAAPYKATKKGDALDFEATIESKAEGSIVWRGSVRNGQITGNALWSKPKQKDIEYRFSGAEDRSGRAAAAARSDIEKTFGFVPTFTRQISDQALPGVWDQMKGLQMSQSTALSGRVKELIGLAVASQIPCTYCTLAHVEFSRLSGASDEERSEAIAVGGLVRFWSTFLNGMAVDHTLFDRELAKMIESAKKGTAPQMPAFLDKNAQATVGGAWRELMDVEMTNTALSAKEKSLISLSVASQIPCSYCIKADTAFAKLSGASDQEITEAVSMAALVRNMSTLLNGHQVDRDQFSRELDRIVANFKKRSS